MKRYQERMLSLLAIEKENGKDFLTLDFIKQRLGFSSVQMGQTKNCLLKKELIKIKGEKVYLKDYSRVYTDRVCGFLTKKNGRPYCPIKKHVISERDVKHFCGVVICNGIPIEMYPHCIGWYRPPPTVERGTFNEPES